MSYLYFYLSFNEFLLNEQKTIPINEVMWSAKKAKKEKIIVFNFTQRNVGWFDLRLFHFKICLFFILNVVFLVYSIWLPLYYFFFPSINEPGLGSGIDPGMALTPFLSSIGWDLNPRPSNHESCFLTTRQDFRPQFQNLCEHGSVT